MPAPFSVEALRYARRLASSQNRHLDDRQALIELLERWDAGLLSNPAERRIALRISEQRAARVQAATAEDGLQTGVREGGAGTTPLELVPDLAGDDDDAAEIDADYYGDALGVG